MKDIIYSEELNRHQRDGIDFDGHFNEWKFEYIPKTYLKESELSGDEWRKGGSVKIYINGDCVLDEFCRTEENAVVLVSKHLYELKCFFETFLGVDKGDWKKSIVGMKVYHSGVPSIVESYLGDGEIILKTEDGEPYKIYGSKLEDMKESPDHYEDEWNDKDRVHITDTRIFWWRK